MNKTNIVWLFIIILITFYVGYQIGCIDSELEHKNHLEKIEKKLDILEMKI